MMATANAVSHGKIEPDSAMKRVGLANFCVIDWFCIGPGFKGWRHVVQLCVVNSVARQFVLFGGGFLEPTPSEVVLGKPCASRSWRLSAWLRNGCRVRLHLRHPHPGSVAGINSGEDPCKVLFARTFLSPENLNRRRRTSS